MSIFKSKVCEFFRQQLQWIPFNYLLDGGTQPPTKDWIKNRFEATNDISMIAQVAKDFQSKN